jgi:hypothetical protein
MPGGRFKSTAFASKLAHALEGPVRGRTTFFGKFAAYLPKILDIESFPTVRPHPR